MGKKLGMLNSCLVWQVVGPLYFSFKARSYDQFGTTKFMLQVPSDVFKLIYKAVAASILANEVNW